MRLFYTVAGRGIFVAAKNKGLLGEENLRQIEEHLGAALSLARLSGLSREELREMLDTLEEEEA